MIEPFRNPRINEDHERVWILLNSSIINIFIYCLFMAKGYKGLLNVRKVILVEDVYEQNL